jgi:hypothetical protein
VRRRIDFSYPGAQHLLCLRLVDMRADQRPNAKAACSYSPSQPRRPQVFLFDHIGKQLLVGYTVRCRILNLGICALIAVTASRPLALSFLAGHRDAAGAMSILRNIPVARRAARSRLN